MMGLHIIGLNEKLLKGVNELTTFLGFELVDDGTIVKVCQGNVLKIEYKDNQYLVTYSVEVEVFKAIALIVKNEITFYEKKRSIAVMAYMIDSSRNAIRSISTLKNIIKYLAILGYNELQIYTEDTYLLEDEPYFGTFRGSYKEKELKEVIEYAEYFAIEVVPCIQTLAHLNAITCKPHYFDILDYNDILLVDEEKTYKLIEKMFIAIRKIFKSNKVNVGLDEAHMLGLGRYLDLNGYNDRYDIFLRHLNKVNEIARKYEFKAMMWSDMFFRICSKGNYYGDGEITQNVIDDVPTDITLCYWDYDNITETEYERMFRRHKMFNNNIRFTTATWNWMGLAPNYARTDLVVEASIKASKKAMINEYFLTSWGDNGSEASYLTSIPTLFDSSAMIYDENNNSLFESLFNVSINEFKKIDMLNRASINGHYVTNPGKYLLYNDYLCGMFDEHTDPSYTEYYKIVVSTLKKINAKLKIGNYYFNTLITLGQILTLKARIGVDIRKTYHEKNELELIEITKKLKKILKLIDQLLIDFKNQWYLENKTYGFEVQEIRLGGLKERTKSVLDTLTKYLNKEINIIEELEEKTLPYLEDRVGKDIFMNFYHKMITHNVY